MTALPHKIRISGIRVQLVAAAFFAVTYRLYAR